MKKNLIRYILPLFFAIFAYQGVYAQNAINEVENDSLEVKIGIFDYLSAPDSKIKINQSSNLKSDFENYIQARSKERKIGYRILVFYENDQQARVRSGEIETELKSAYPNFKVYRSYASPYFIVHIGNFRTKSDAIWLYNKLLPDYPNAKIVKARISWFNFNVY